MPVAATYHESVGPSLSVKEGEVVAEADVASWELDALTDCASEINMFDLR